MSGSDFTATPLIGFFEGLGYTADSSNGRKVFKTFSTVEDELNSLCNGVGLRDISDSGVLELKGKDVLDFLHRITTNNLKNLQKENIARTIFTTEKGRIIDAAHIINFESQQLCITSGYHRHKVKSWIDKYIIADDVTVTDTGDKYAVLELLGPQADSFVTLVSGNIVNNIPPGTFRVVNSEGMLFFLLKFPETPHRNRYWFISDQDNGKMIINYFLSNKGLFDFNLIGEEAYNIYRIEQGIPLAPYEINDEYNPHEAGLMQLVDSRKGCYIGQEVIARLETYDKVKRTLKGVKFNSSSLPEDRLLTDESGNEAGIITSTTYSLKHRAFIGLAYIRKSLTDDGRELVLKDSGTKVFVKNLPFRK
jgi:tRNA-modifying protein YgfZ